MKTLDRYLMTYQAKLVTGILALFVLLLLMVQVLEDLDLMMRYDATASEAIRFFAYNLPWNIPQLLPYAFLIGSVLTAHHLVRKGEVAGLLAAGISPRRIFSGVLLLAAAASLLLIVAWDRVAIPARAMSRVIESQIKQERTTTTERGLFTVLTENRTLHVQITGSEDIPMVGVTVLEFDQETGMRLERRLDALRARPMKERPGTFQLEEVLVHRYPAGATETVSETDWHAALPYQMFEGETAAPAFNPNRYKELPFAHLHDHIQRLEAVGEQTVRYRYHLQERLAYPWNCFALALLGLIVPLRRRGMNMVIELSIALVLVVCFHIVQTFFETLGNEGTLNVMVAAWFTPVAFSAAAFWILERTGQA